MSNDVLLIQSIRDSLSGITGDWSADVLATAFTARREQAANRLAAFAALLETENEYQALRLAEVEPRLPDSIAQLTFAEEPQWLEYCRKHHLPNPPPLNQDALQALQKLYLRGITTSSPFYQECLAAISAGDDETALQLIRSIVRLNPSDTDARNEMERRLKNKLAPQLAALKTALQQNHQEAILWWLDELERLGTSSSLTDDEVYIAATTVRAAIKRDKAATAVEDLLTSTEAQQQHQNWQAVSPLLDRIRKLTKEHELTLTPQQTARLNRLDLYVAQQQANVRKEAESNEILSTFSAFADRVNARLHGPPALGLAEARRLDGAFGDHWISMDQARVSIPEPELIRLHEIASALKLRIEQCRKRGGSRGVKIASIAPLVAIVFGVVWASYIYSCAQDYVKQLEELHQRDLAGSANKLMGMIVSTASWGVNSVPSLRTKIDEIDKWTRVELEELHNAEQLLSDIEAIVDNNLVEMEPAVLMAKLTEATNKVQDLVPDLLPAPLNRLGRLRVKINSRFGSLLAKNVKIAQSKMADLNKLADGLNFSTPVQDLSAPIATIVAGLSELDKFQQPSIPELRLPPHVVAPLEQLRGKAKPFITAMATLNETKGAMAKARTLEAYKKPLEVYAALPFAESRSAAAIVNDFPSEDVMAARLLFNGNLDLWRTAKQQAKEGYNFVPKQVTEKELKQLLAIRDDARLNTSGPAKKLLDASGLNQIVDASGKVYQKPLFQVIDALIRSTKSDPLLKAYLITELHAIIKTRPTEWGLHYCPQLVVDVIQLNAILGNTTLRSGDWTQASLKSKWTPQLQPFFEYASAHKPYYETASALQALVANVADSGVTYAGYIDDTRTVHIDAPIAEATEFWGLSATVPANPIAINFTGGTANPDDLKSVQQWSPLFLISMETRKP